MSRFNDNQDGTITDTETSLTWQKKDSRQLTGRWMHLEKSQKLATEQNEAKIGGFNDWRVPKLEDIKTIYDKNFSNRDLETTKSTFTNILKKGELTAAGPIPSMENER